MATTVQIEEILVNELGYLSVRPQCLSARNYEHIYRDASGIRWNSTMGSLIAYEPSKWKPAALFWQIIAAARNEYGHNLAITRDTAWVNVSPSLKAEIVSNSSWVNISPEFRAEILAAASGAGSHVA
jgi:hypothetical protein